MSNRNATLMIEDESGVVQDKLEDALQHAENDQTRYLLRGALQDLVINADTDD